MTVMQILLSRICSVMFYYHFAFAGVTLAMLGLTAGALKVYINPRRFTAATVDYEMAMHCLLAAMFLAAGSLILVDFSGRLVSVAKSYGMGEYLDTPIILAAAAFGLYGILKAFAAMGVSVTLLLTYFPSYSGRLYAADLTSAALGCIAVVAALYFLDPVSIILFLATVLAVVAWRFLASGRSQRRTGDVRMAAIIFCLLFAGQSASYLSGSPLFKARIGKLAPLENLVFERWNTYSHVGIYPYTSNKPFGWGFGTALDEKKYKNVKQYWLKIDADAGTVLTQFDGDLTEMEYLRYDVVNLGYHLRKIGHTGIIGVGGGRDVLSALTFGTPKITGIEINPAIFEALNKPFAGFTGRLSSYPNVKLVNAEARSFISSHDLSYDMIQISLIDTWATTAAGGLALSENKLYTREAWREFLEHLNADGLLTVSRWFIRGQHHGELYRMLSIANEALTALNPALTVRNHVLAANANNIVTVAVSKRPFSEGEISNFLAICGRYGFTPLMTPHLSFDAVSEMIMSGKVTEKFYASLPLDFSAPTDDRPFFFNMARFGDVLFGRTGRSQNERNNIAVSMLFFLSIFTGGALSYVMLLPMAKLYREQKQSSGKSALFAIYFAGIGLGFMFIEMSMMQRLMIFLGHPVYGLSVILFTMLLFSGIGSYFAKFEKLCCSGYVLPPALLIVLLIATGWLMPVAIARATHFGTPPRILISVALLMPISFFMGMMFPLGIGAAKKMRSSLLPWFWALNGVASVCGSIFSIVVSMSFGISTAFAVGILCYVPCLFISLRLRKTFTPAPMALAFP
ncbi:MAG: hypothetical protein WBX25_00535 [Rhodomicrobium sp.]